MKAPAFLVGVLVAATALVALSPTVAASAQVCTSLTSPACPGAFCKDENGDRVFQSSECRHADPCAFQSDCCGGVLGSGFWCPEDS